VSSRNEGLQNASAWGLSQHPTVWTFAMVVLFAVLALALLRHFFGSIKVDFGTK
jgi:hypothetical protein